MPGVMRRTGAPAQRDHTDNQERLDRLKTSVLSGNQRAVKAACRALPSICVAQALVVATEAPVMKVSIVRCLLDKTPSGTTEVQSSKNQALLNASARGASKIARLLLANGADPKTEGLVFFAASGGHGETLEVLLRLQANFNEKSSDGITPLMAAAQTGDSRSIRALFELGGEAVRRRVNELDPSGKTALIHAIDRRRAAVAMLLLKEDLTQRHTRDLKKMTTLMYAAKSGLVEVVRELLKDTEVKAHLHDQDGDEGYTALMHAVDAGHLEVVKELLKEKKVQQGTRWKSAPYEEGERLIGGWNALMLAVKAGREDIVVELLKVPEVVESLRDAVDAEEKTALALAKERQATSPSDASLAIVQKLTAALQ